MSQGNKLNHNMDRTELWQQLSEKGWLTGSLNPEGKQVTPWFVKILVAACGWLASLFFMGFIGIGIHEVLDEPFYAFILGAFLVTAAYYLLNYVDSQRLDVRRSRLDFLEHLALAVSLAGQLLITFALYDSLHDGAIASVLVGCVQLVLALWVPNFLHRSLSAFMALVFWYVGLLMWGTEGSYALNASNHQGLVVLFIPVVSGVVAWLWLKELSFGRRIRCAQAIAYGFTLSLLLIKGWIMFGSPSWLGLRYEPDEQALPLWVGELLSGGVVFYVAWALLKSYGVYSRTPIAMMAFGACLVITLFSLDGIGFSLPIMILVLGMHNANRWLMGLGILSLLVFVSRYYYFMDVSLLMKAGHLCLFGTLVLAGRYILMKHFSSSGTSNHDQSTLGGDA